LFEKNKMKKKGFSLIELLIVVIILNFLTILAFPKYVSTIEKARSVEAIINIGALCGAMDRYWYQQHSSTGAYTFAEITTLDVDDPNNQTYRDFKYVFKDNSTMDKKSYIIRAERLGKESTYWLQWLQTDNRTGKMYKSPALDDSVSRK
jgi:prepilin-type N-terminal cleavage/methylation domain-containing protein